MAYRAEQRGRREEAEEREEEPRFFDVAAGGGGGAFIDGSAIAMSIICAEYRWRMVGMIIKVETHTSQANIGKEKTIQTHTL